MPRETVARLSVDLDDYEHYALRKIKEHYGLHSNATAMRKAINSLYAVIRDRETAPKTPGPCGIAQKFDPAGAALTDMLLKHARIACARGRRI